MDVRRQRVADLFCNQQQFILLDLQRQNRWNGGQVEQFWKDIEGLTERESNASRLFLGNLTLASSPTKWPNTIQLQVIDGQHRLIAVAMLLAALRDWEASRGNDEKAAEIQDTYLCHPFRSGAEAHKLVFAGDPPGFLPIVSSRNRSGTLNWLVRFYDFFYGKISEGRMDADRLSWALLSQTDVITVTDEYRSAIKMFLSVATKGRPTSSSVLNRRAEAS